MKTKKSSFTIELLGWVGTALVLGGYILLSTGVIGNDPLYHGMMLFGSIGVALISYRQRAWQPFALNVAFALAAFYAILRLTLVF